MSDALLLLAAVLANLVGMGWLALAMESHWEQLQGTGPLRHGHAVALRCIGVLAIGSALLICLRADHATMAVLVWIMSLSGAAVAIALLLTWRPAWLAVIVWPSWR